MKETKKPKRITLEDLAAMTANGFSESDRKFNERLGETETRLGNRIDVVESSLNKRIDEVEITLSNRIDGVEARLGGRIDALNITLKTHLQLSQRQYRELKQRDQLIIRKGKIAVTKTELNQLA